MSGHCSNPPGAGLPTHALILAIASTWALLLLAPLEGFTFAWDGLRPFCCVVVALMGVHAYYRMRGNEPAFAAITGAFGLVLWLGLVDGYLAYVALAAGAPMADAQLATISGIGGFDHHAFVAWLTRFPGLVTTLEYAYRLTVPLLHLTIVLLTLTGQTERLNRMIGHYAVLLTLTIGLSALFPARGPFLLQPLPPEVRALLPSGAGDFYRELFEAIRDGRMRLISMDIIEGVVVFPSFHTAMALMIAHAVSKTRGLAIVGWVYAVLVMISTIPFGGHYLADVEISILLFVVVAILSKRFSGEPVAAPAGADFGPDMPQLFPDAAETEPAAARSPKG